MPGQQPLRVTREIRAGEIQREPLCDFLIKVAD
jgi:hypothetical protein